MEMVDAIVQEVNLNAKEIGDRVQGIIQFPRNRRPMCSRSRPRTEETECELWKTWALSSEEAQSLVGQSAGSLAKFTV